MLFPLHRLPDTISGIGIDLWAITPSVWPCLQPLMMSEHQFLARQIWDAENDARFFYNPDAYRRLCRKLDENINRQTEDAPSRHYFIYSIIYDRIVGYAGIYKPPHRQDIMEIGYATLPKYEHQGFASEAALMLSELFLREDIAPVLHADIVQENEASARILIKAGFLETGISLCAIKGKGAVISRHFKKTKASATPVNIG